MRLSPIFLLVAGTTLLRLGFAATTGLGVDESYMVTAGRVLSLGYFDHPPASWWLSWAAAHLFGTETPVVVRLPFILLFAASQVLAWRIGCRTGGAQAGFWAAVALNLSPVFGVTTGSWVLPDGPLDAALLAAASCLLNALAARDGGRGLLWWSAAGLCAGSALLSKYSAVLTMGGALLYLLTAREHRCCFGKPGPYVAALLALTAFAPVLVWNGRHGWASFAFQADRAVGMRFHSLAPLATLGGEALFVLPWIWLPMMLLLARAFSRGAPWRHRLLAWLAAPPIAGFALVSLWSSQRVLFHWAAPGYLMLFPLLGEAIAARLDRLWVRRAVGGTAALLLAALLVVASQIQFDWLGGRLAAVMRKDPTAEGLDWTSIRDDLSRRGLLSAETAGAFSWREAGKIGYALGPEVRMLCLSRDARQFGFADPLTDNLGRDVLLLAVEPEARARQEAEPWFASVDVLAGTSIRLQGQVFGAVTVMRGHGLRIPP